MSAALRPIPLMIPISGSLQVLRDCSRLDLVGSEERADLISQFDLDDLEKPGFDEFIDWAVEQREARRQHLHAQSSLIYPEILVQMMDKYKSTHTHSPIPKAIVSVLRKKAYAEALQIVLLCEREAEHNKALEARGQYNLMLEYVDI